MIKKWVHSFLESMGLLAVIFAIVSLFFLDVMQMRFFHLVICVAAPIHLFSFFTFQLKLFSERIWIRRIIVMAFSVCFMFAMNVLFGFVRFATDYIILFGAAILLFILVSVFVYYIGDKIEQRNLDLINQKLSTKNETMRDEEMS